MAAEAVVWLSRLVAAEAVGQSSVVMVVWSLSVCVFSLMTWAGECVGLSSQLQITLTSQNGCYAKVYKQ